MMAEHKGTSEPTKTREIQAHGFLWEKELLLNVYGATPEELKEIKEDDFFKN